MPDIDAREALRRLAKARGVSLTALSTMIGRNKAYVQQFVERGTPRRLDEDDRLTFARYFDIDERELGAREPWRPSNGTGVLPASTPIRVARAARSSPGGSSAPHVPA